MMVRLVCLSFYAVESFVIEAISTLKEVLELAEQDTDV